MNEKRTPPTARKTHSMAKILSGAARRPVVGVDWERRLAALWARLDDTEEEEFLAGMGELRAGHRRGMKTPGPTTKGARRRPSRKADGGGGSGRTPDLGVRCLQTPGPRTTDGWFRNADFVVPVAITGAVWRDRNEGLADGAVVQRAGRASVRACSPGVAQRCGARQTRTRSGRAALLPSGESGRRPAAGASRRCPR